MDLPVDAVVADRYRIVGRLGRGGMAVVYRAHDRVLDRRVAVKVLAGHLLDDDRSVARFGREARAAAGLNHPNVVAVHDAASDGDVHYLVMELVEGSSLADRLRDGPLDEDEALAVVDRVAAALGAAHDRGLVHRDVKPSNILLTGGGEVKVTDFGIARAVAAAATQTAVVMGSVPYVAPEQLDGRAGADPRSDLYALGCVLFECLTGRAPFVADTSAAVLGQHLHAAAPRVRDHRPDVDPHVDELVASLLAKDAAARPASAGDLRERIARVQTDQPPVPPGGGAGAAAAGAAAAGVAEGALARGSGTEPDEPDDSAAAPTEVVDPAAAPTEVVDRAATPTEVVDPGSAPTEVVGVGAAGSGIEDWADRTALLDPDEPPTGSPGADGSGGRGPRRWLVVLVVLLVVGLVAWLLADAFGDGAPGPEPTPTPDRATATEAPTEQPPATEEPATEDEPATEPTTPPEVVPPAPSPTPAPSPEPTTEPTTSAPTTPPAASPTATEAALVTTRELLVRGERTGQLTGEASEAIGERVTEVARRLAGDDDDRLARAREDVAEAREEVTRQAQEGEVVPGMARQLDAALVDLAATLT